MGIGRRSDGSYYIRCDWDDCSHKIDLKAKDFWSASDEAKRLGWKLAKDSDGRWLNFHTEFCKTCYFAPQYVVRRKVNTYPSGVDKEVADPV